MASFSDKKGSGSFTAILAWSVILIGFAAFFTYLLDNIYNPNQKVISKVSPAGQASVTLIANQSGHYVANGKINDVDVVFLLDTGATHVSVPGNIATKIGLKRGNPVQAQTANGVIVTHSTMLDSVTIGNIVMTDVRGGINPFMEGNAVLLGMSFLKHLELTQRNDTLTITVP